MELFSDSLSSVDDAALLEPYFLRLCRKAEAGDTDKQGFRREG